MNDISPQLEQTLAIVRERQEESQRQLAVVSPSQHVDPVLQFTEAQKQMIRDTYANGASQKEFEVLMEIARLRRLNPLLKQIHFVKRWNRALGREVWTAQTGIDGYRAIAERTGKYNGQDEPEFEYSGDGKDRKLTSCKVKVYRKDWERPAVGVAYWAEYVQTAKDGKPTAFWADMPHSQLAKCAEALALRKAFPEELGGLYTNEEMAQADSEPHGQLGNPRSMHTLPGESPDQEAKESSVYNEIMEQLRLSERDAFDPACTWEIAQSVREIIGSKGSPSDLGKQLSALYHSDSVSAGQRSEMGKLWNRVDRKLTQLEGKLKPPPVEASFVDEPDGTEAFGPERQPGEDDQ